VSFPLQSETVSDSHIQDRAPAVSPWTALSAFLLSFLISAWMFSDEW